MKKYVVFCLFLAFVCMAKAQTVSLDEAYNAANNFLGNQNKGLARCVKVEKQNTDTLYYVFNGNNAFVVISADRRTLPVLAFSDAGNWDAANVSPAAQMWFNHYAQQLAALRQQPYRAEDAHTAWNLLTSRQPVLRTQDAVSPLMQSHWGQENNYNYYCPADAEGPGGRVVTGCVATALSQLMYYFRFPESGVGTYTYVDSTYGEQSVDYASATYDFSAMCDEPTTVNTAMSRLIYHCGVGMDMNYGVNGSGVFNHSAARVLREHFKYAPETQYVFRDSTTQNWDSLIISHLNRNIPLYYAGWSVPNIDGHGFICDGYQLVDSSYYYHFNFGWDGSRDGYFYTNALTVAGSNFNLAQELIVNAYPDTVNYQYPVAQPLTGTKVLTTPAGSFPDGITPVHACPAGMDYTWIIRPDVENLTKIALNLDYALATGDSLIVSSDNQTIDNQTYTSDSSSVSLRWSCSEITVRLVTANPDAVIHASYQSVQPTYCEEMSYSSASTGTITDGSSDDNYNPLTFCQFKIVVSGTPAIAAHFSYFDLEEGHDFLTVYYKEPSEDNWLATYTGTMPDTTIIFQRNKLFFVFSTDATGNHDGFSFDYERSTGLEDAALASTFVYPNPATTVLHIEAEQLMDEVVLRDVTGREILRSRVGDIRYDMAVNSVPAGIYLLQIVSNGQTIVRKVLIQK